MGVVEYKDNIIPYELKRTKIKNLYIHIKDGRVIVKAPYRLSEKYIKEFVDKKSKWICEKIKEYENNPKKNEIKITEEDIGRLKEVVEISINKYTNLLGVRPNKVRIKDIKYAWGSCTSNKNITINLKLANKSEEIIEYVVLHEMCHLIYMNHSKEFWNLVGKYIKDYKKLRKLLNE